MAKIYHYTSIETLALILKSKKIRFNRLDQADDVEESCYGSGDLSIKLGQYVFVSCWTKNKEENLALWKMYTNYKGIRIGLDEEMFITYDNGTLKSFFSEPLILKKDYFTSSIINEAKLYGINYVPDPIPYINNLIKKEVRNGIEGINIDLKNIGIYKRKEWECQQESRFKIILLPYVGDEVDIKNGDGVMDFILSLHRAITENVTLNRQYIDVSLNPEKMTNMEIMLGPQTTEEEKDIVRKLLQEYPEAEIKNSYFDGKIRKKQ